MFREQIRKHYDHLSRSYRRVADFILSDYRTAAFMTAAALADAVDVDTTTVVRFAQRLGYPGFPELIEDIQTQVKLELSQTYATPVDEGGVYGKIQSFVAKDRANLEKALAHNTPDALENIVDMLPRRTAHRGDRRSLRGAAGRVVRGHVAGSRFARRVRLRRCLRTRDSPRSCCSQRGRHRHDAGGRAFRSCPGAAICAQWRRSDARLHS